MAARRAPLTRERVVRAGVALADREGVAALSMRRLGGALGVEAMSLYNHVGGKDDLLDGMVDAVFAEIELPAADEPWKAAMRRRAVSVREVLSRHPWASALMNSRRSPGPMTLRHLDAMIGSLRAAGFSVAATAHAVSLIDSYVYGFVAQEAALPFESGEQTAELASEIMGAFAEGEYPHLTELTVQHVLQPGYSYADEFALGLEWVLDAIERRAPAEPG